MHRRQYRMQVAMICANCGATIADRAIVCYKCGTPTAIPEAPARPTRPPRTPVSALVVAGAGVVSAATGWFFTPPGTLHTVLIDGSVVAFAAAIVLLGRRR